ncbi:hypothetical protein Dsin_005537 [Dipteronia sinensis]|uniref:Uncharacterized protein n=1 Tax=Dipteronia sinensis TaxID=43782 RepID=A0AAE0AXQ6_9ROSI|nr:hypothetical protein Dsin_005537 [Dipteronia sinensis]
MEREIKLAINCLLLGLQNEKEREWKRRDSRRFRLPSPRISLAVASDLNPPRVNGINKLDGHFELASSDAGMLLRNELESPPPLRDRMSVLEQRVVNDLFVTLFVMSSIQGDNPGSSTSITSRGKASKAPRNSSLMVLDSSSKVHPTSGAFQGWEQLKDRNASI